MGVLGAFLERGLLLEPRDESADETHVVYVIAEGDFLYPAAAALAAVILAAGRVDQVRLARFDADDRKMGHDLLDDALFRVLDPVDDVAVLKLCLHRPGHEGAFRKNVHLVLTARSDDLFCLSEIGRNVLSPFPAEDHVLAVLEALAVILDNAVHKRPARQESEREGHLYGLSRCFGLRKL